MDKSLNDIYAQAERIVANYPEQMKRRSWFRQEIYQIACRVRTARGIDMFTKERDVKHGIKTQRDHPA